MSDIQNEMMAQKFHQNFSRFAPEFGYKPSNPPEQSSLPWLETTPKYRRFLALVVGESLSPFYARIRRLESDLSRLQDELDEAKDIIRYGGTWTPNK